MPYFHCVDYDAEFYREDDQHYKVRCIPCWQYRKDHGAKRPITNGPAPVSAKGNGQAYIHTNNKLKEEIEDLEEKLEERNAYARKLYDACQELKADNRRLAAKVDALQQQLEEARTVPKGKLDAEMVKRLIQLCHPDKHAGSKASTIATAFLNSLR